MESTIFNIVDFSTVMETAGGDEAFLKEIVKIFLAETPDNMQGVVQGSTDGNYDQVAKIAHKLKSTFAIVGVPDGWKLFNEIENKTRKAEGDPDITDLVQQAAVLSEGVTKEFQTWLDRKQ